MRLKRISLATRETKRGPSSTHQSSPFMPQSPPPIIIILILMISQSTLCTLNYKFYNKLEGGGIILSYDPKGKIILKLGLTQLSSPRATNHTTLGPRWDLRGCYFHMDLSLLTSLLTLSCLSSPLFFIMTKKCTLFSWLTSITFHFGYMEDRLNSN